MEDWLAHLEMDMEPVSTIINDACQQYHHQNETMEACFFQQLAAALDEDLPYPFSGEGDTPSPKWDESDLSVIEQFTSASYVCNNYGNQNFSNDNSTNDHGNNNCCHERVTSQPLQNKEETAKKIAVSGGAKRKRQPSQVQEHIIAERKRRELLSQMFISLSAIVPGLKKMDKTSVLGEAIKYMKQLQEKVKALEEVASKRTVESIVVVKKSQMLVDDIDGSEEITSFSTVDQLSPGGSGGGGGSRKTDNLNNLLPEIEVKLTGKALLLRIYYEQQKEILPTVLAELNKHGMRATNCSVIPFDNIALDITIAAQMMERNYIFNVKDFIKSLRCAL